MSFSKLHFNAPEYFSTWISETLAWARTGLPSARKSVYCTLRLSATEGE